MGARRYKAEEIISKLREAEVFLADGTSVGDVVKRLGVTQVTYYRWRKEYGGMKVDQAKRLKALEKENSRLKRLLADAELDKAILKEAASGNWRSALRVRPLRRSTGPSHEPVLTPPAGVSSSSMRVASSASRNAGLAGWWASIGRLNGESRGSSMTRIRSRPRSSSSPASTAAMGIAGSLRCSGATAGT